MDDLKWMICDQEELWVENKPYEEYKANFTQKQAEVQNQLLLLRNNTTCVCNMTNEEMIGFAHKVIAINSAVSSQPEEWTLQRGYRLCFEIMSTIGYGSTPPKTQAGRLIAVFYTLVGIPIFIFMLKSIGEVINRQITKIVAYAEKKLLKREEPKNAELKVLIGFTVLLILDVTLEVIFVSKQRDFTLIDSLYCVIITATTVGFGDVMLENELTMIISLSLLSTVLDGTTCYAAKKIEEQREKQGCTCFGRKNNRNVPRDELEAYGTENNAVDQEGKEKTDIDRDQTTMKISHLGQ
ncbi:hypothetical protein QZH41_002006 [Actinostola sp. cb2023]|nr:hypothetical protein QZH41_002006 [Actinostola sp. cb2023]